MSAGDWNTRLTLLQRAQDPDDHQAWDDFTNYYHKFVMVILHQMGVNENDKADLAQEVLLSLWKSLPKLDFDSNRAKFRTWMSSIIHRRVADHYRKVYRRSEKMEKFRSEEALEESISQPEIESLIQSEWEVYVVQTAMERVTPIFSGKAMEVFKMTMDNISSDVIAGKLDLQRNSVNKLKNRVKERLLSEIQQIKQEMRLFNE
ncbi:sigma-70 family RNA polymerase sigma factor [Lentisphaera profundi]|uniref:Sigma-70 family RNA polymerase sigma factor n=1 Tax=Lentisphaera profundi TaxID=1658616 RepID=A0ABY7VRL0_9BACT|nr:sigma-70 family RNA polymerase sigma factor [Lentisphaera profundi]WDE96677.1 sigma-70 family RNA polymerase sigma factor [Lentisphaera profundi]